MGLQQALAAAKAGRLADACGIAERALVHGGDPVALNALLGMLRTDLGDHQAAVRHLEIAHAARPQDIRIAINLASALVKAGEMQRGLDVASADLAFSDGSLQLARIRAFAADQLLDFGSAAEALEHVVAAAPDDWESWNNLANARRALEDWEGGLEAQRRSIDLNPYAAPSRLNYASALWEAGRFKEAEEAYRQMAAEFPEDAKPLRELHVILKEMNRDEDAAIAIREAVSREPADIELLLGYASDLSLLLRTEEAEAEYRRVLALDPQNPAAFLGIAVGYELSNRSDEFLKLIAEAEAHGVAADVISFIRAFHYRRTKQFAKGVEELGRAPAELESARRFQLLGQLLDGAGRHDEAFAAFSRMNELLAEDRSRPLERAARYRQLIADAPKIVTKEWVASWRQVSVDERPAPTFLLGFPRSGTTLLDTILMSHPSVEVLEEEPALRKAHELFPDLSVLATASDEQIGAARDVYYNVVAGLTPMAAGSLLIDKNPLTMNLLPLVRRLFPDAPIILALRHPCDVLLSCFMANFRLNDGMANFLRLDTAADLYDASFSYYEHVQQLMPMRTHTVVYENVVADRETELRKLFDFLGLDWHHAVLDHQSTALKRGRIKTASYAQVLEPIYTRSAGRWENYRKHLEPILPVLRPWAKKFEYVV